MERLCVVFEFVDVFGLFVEGLFVVVVEWRVVEVVVEVGGVDDIGGYVEGDGEFLIDLCDFE